MTTTYTANESRLAKAVEEAQATENPVLGSIAKQHQVDRMTLVRRLEGSRSRSTRVPTNRKMTPEMEKALARYCKTLREMGVAATVEHLRKAALHMLGSKSDSNELDVKLGKHWIERYIDRNNLFTVNQKSREVNRVIATDRRTMRSYFMDLRMAIDEFGILVC